MRSPSDFSFKAIGWALLSQLVWIPLLAIDLHDRWVAHQRDVTPPGQPLPPSPIARATPFSLNDLLGAARPVQQLAGQANQAVSGALGQAVRGASTGVGVLLSSAGSSASSLLDRPFSASLETAAVGTSASPAQIGDALVPAQPGPSLLGRAFTRAQLLGGSIGLADLQEGPMAPLALAERALQRSNGDLLAPLPSMWREPMRQALLRLPGDALQLSPARTVIVPSSAVTRPLEVPLALQSDGSVDVLEPPSDPAVLREIESWSRQQRLPARGSLQPAVVHLHPLPAVAPLTPVAISPSAPARQEAPAQAAAGAEALQPPLRSESPEINAAIPLPIDREAAGAVPAPVIAPVAEAAPPAAPAP